MASVRAFKTSGRLSVSVRIPSFDSIKSGGAVVVVITREASAAALLDERLHAFALLVLSVEKRIELDRRSNWRPVSMSTSQAASYRPLGRLRAEGFSARLTRELPWPPRGKARPGTTRLTSPQASASRAESLFAGEHQLHGPRLAHRAGQTLSAARARDDADRGSPAGRSSRSRWPRSCRRPAPARTRRPKQSR